ncbi:DUF202 domain-containing protein [Affinibrenneria salicis]|uniref:DUF202 domain-containing protein n=1 Tax=Affinibrenneria salicis TaxID=2590031 RepID=A0A5J5FVF7_9GAMM|nr:DUF202 domain-containing protein [Affinibrenneria salicis]KAA8997318.1 DUF202 domain-containing protein [Affinibrenneria salicis]
MQESPSHNNKDAKKTPWQQQGSTPDYRFSLANERTFLAWIRTALAFLAGAIAIDQLAPDFASPLARNIIALFLTLAAALLALMAYRRWAANELAIRLNQAMPYTRLLLAIAVFVAVIALAFLLLMLAT